MTYRYYNIRREINNDNSEKGLKGFRSFKELKSLYKPFHWIVFVGVILTFIGLFITLVILKNKLWSSIPLVILIILVNIWEYKCEKSYNQKARKNELDTIDEKYKQYLNNTYIIFKNNGINTRKELAALKNECNFIFDRRENKFKILSNKIFELFIGVPIGALISSLVDKNDALLHTKIILVLMLGISIYVIITTAKYISYYTEGYRKDQRLLDAVMEMEYYFSIMGDNKIEKTCYKKSIGKYKIFQIEKRQREKDLSEAEAGIKVIEKLVFMHRLIRFVVTKNSKNNVAEFSCNSTDSS